MEWLSIQSFLSLSPILRLTHSCWRKEDKLTLAASRDLRLYSALSPGGHTRRLDSTILKGAVESPTVSPSFLPAAGCTNLLSYYTSVGTASLCQWHRTQGQGCMLMKGHPLFPSMWRACGKGTHCCAERAEMENTCAKQKQANGHEEQWKRPGPH